MRYIDSNELDSIHNSNEKFILVDIREKYELENCSIEFAIHIPMAQVEGKISELKSFNKIVLMCQTGKRASALGNYMITEFGIENIFVLEGGISSYLKLD